MASAGAHSDHVNHVSTQLPYALTVAAISTVCYGIAGVAEAVLGGAGGTATSLVLLAVAIVLELAVLTVLRLRLHVKQKETTNV
jgi:Na+/H+ antiporter NhaC